jgi:hypothetical protein
MMQWSYDDPITGERLQSLAQATILTPSILGFHTSLPRSAAHEVVIFRGTHRELEPDDSAIRRLRGRRCIFVYSHLLESFVQRILPRLDHRFVLISHNSDHGVDDRFRGALDDPRIAHWFAQNTLTHHPKLTALPIGIANAQWAHGNLRALVDVANASRPARRSVVYVNFEVRTNPAVRVPLLQRLEGLPVAWRAPPRPFADYLADMAGCRWTVSPPGNGVDCHRTWEALYLGITPIVLKTASGAGLHDGLPIIQLPDLAVLDAPGLEEAEQVLADRAKPEDCNPVERIKMSYWRGRIARAVMEAGR